MIPDLINPDMSIEARIKTMIQSEIDEYRIHTDTDLANLDAFRAALIEPALTPVNFGGGVTRRCWTVTRVKGDYRVVYIPLAGHFSLCVESDSGPLDVGVHGTAIGCYCSV
ncbi:MAG: hypothetical protein AAGG57_18840 [Pseudomonadota bacterium]